MTDYTNFGAQRGALLNYTTAAKVLKNPSDSEGGNKNI